MVGAQYDVFTRNRITELRKRKNVSEHKMSLDLGKSGSYIRAISSGLALPSLKELFNISAYFDMTRQSFLLHWLMKIPYIEEYVKKCECFVRKIWKWSAP